MSNRELAQSLAAEFNWSVYPVGVNKAPLWSTKSKFPHGALDASTDAGVIDELWKPYPDALIAVRLDKSGLMAIDVDNHEGKPSGELSLARLAAKYGDLPTTVSQISVSGKGWHYIFKAPDCEIRKNLLPEFPSVDFLYHHYIVLGEWRKGRSPIVGVQSLPPAWLKAIREPPKPVYDSDVDSDDPMQAISPPDYVRDLAGLERDRNNKVICPSPHHNDTKPSLQVWDVPGKGGGWYCHGCQWGGDIYEFAALVLGYDKDWKRNKPLAAKIIDDVFTWYEQREGVQSEF